MFTTNRYCCISNNNSHSGTKYLMSQCHRCHMSDECLMSLMARWLMMATHVMTHGPTTATTDLMFPLPFPANSQMVQKPNGPSRMAQMVQMVEVNMPWNTIMRLMRRTWETCGQ